LENGRDTYIKITGQWKYLYRAVDKLDTLFKDNPTEGDGQNQPRTIQFLNYDWSYEAVVDATVVVSSTHKFASWSYPQGHGGLAFFIN